MCRLLVGINLKDGEKFEKMLRLQYPIVSSMPDGLGGVAIAKNNSVKVERSLEDYAKVSETLFKNAKTAKIIALHGRQSTSGDTELGNVHFFKHKKYLFAHNGIVSSVKERTHSNFKFDTQKNTDIIHAYGSDPYTWGEYEAEADEILTLKDIFQNCYECPVHEGEVCLGHETLLVRLNILLERHAYPTDIPIAEKSLTPIKEVKGFTKKTEKEESKKFEACDSLKFLQGLPHKRLTTQILANQIDKRSFTGVGLLLNPTAHKGFIFGTRAIQIQTDRENYLFMYSYEPTTEFYTNYSMCGLRLAMKNPDKTIPALDLAEGVYEFDYSKRFTIGKYTPTK